jgi:hypothetical protein
VKVILQTVESIAVQAMLFNDQEKTLNYPAINQWMKLMNGKSIRLVLLPCVKYLLAGTTEIVQITITLSQCHMLSK